MPRAVTPECVNQKTRRRNRNHTTEEPEGVRPTNNEPVRTTGFQASLTRSARRPALDQVGEPAEGADRPGGHLPAGGALEELDVLDLLERGPGLLEEPEQEVVLGAGRGLLEAVQHLLVGDRGGALGERALLHDVVDATQEGEGRGLELGEAVERLHAAGEPRGG